MEIRQGESHALVGENGAGKSTLMKILAGAEQADEGRILLRSQEIQIDSPIRARALGIAMIYQEFNLIPSMSVAENIFMGKEIRKGRIGWIDWKRMYAETDRLLARLAVRISPREKVERLSVAQQQMVEIIKAVSEEAQIVIMDEPSATLTEHELQNLFDLILGLTDSGVSVIYISHRLEEIYQIAQCVTVLRDGQRIATRYVSDVNHAELIQMMVGRPLTEEFPARALPIGKEIFRVNALNLKGVLHDISFSLREGEILGVAGLVGAHRTEMAMSIFGGLPKDSGDIYIHGHKVDIQGPADAIEAGLGLVTEDRKALGLILDQSVVQNVSLASLGQLSRFSFVKKDEEQRQVSNYVDELKVKTPSLNQLVRNLSGGNQQKIVLSKWLLTQSRIVIFDEPTRGIDVAAKLEIYHLLNSLVARGVGVIMISSELPEILGMSDRILIMREGKIEGKLSKEEATPERVMSIATGDAAALRERPPR